MKAVIKQKDGKEGWAYKDVPRHDPASNEVEIEVKAIGICGSELHLYHDNHFYTPGKVVGHEFSGVISRIGKNVKGWKVGDRVVAEMNKGACGKCEFCRKGMPNFCPHGDAVGYDIDGGWAEYYITPENMLFKIPDNVSYEAATIVEPTNVVCQALIVKETVKTGDIVLVQGCGTIGLLSAMVAKAIGAKTVIITGTDQDESVRLPVAREIDAIDHVVNINKQNLSDIVSEATHNKGSNVIIEASGALSAISSMADNLKKTGNIVVLGESPKEEVPIKWNELVFKACTVYFSFGEVYEAWAKAVELMAEGKLELEKMITHKLPLSEYRRGFELLESKEGLKVILYPDSK